MMLRRERHFGDRVVACHHPRPANVHAMLEEAVAAAPDADAVVHDDVRLTYREFDLEVGRLAAGLAARGVGKGDRVALLLGNGIPFVAMTYAVARRGAILVPLSIRDEAPGIRHALTNSGSKMIVAEAECVRLVPSDAPDLVHRVSVGAAEGFEDYDALRADEPLMEAEPVHEDETAGIMYTSGTTGTPKGAMLTGLGLVHSATNFVVTLELDRADRTIVVAPMSHITGLLAGVHTAIRAGGAVIVMRDFKAEAYLELAARERMTFSVLVPAMYNLILHRAKLSDYDLSAWRVGGYGGAPMPEPTIVRLAEELPGLGLTNCYGATETTSPITVMPSAETANRRLSVGLVVPGGTTLVMDDEGREAPRGEQGELWHHGAMVVAGYWNNPEATAREFVGGFWKSGDIGSMDEDGFVYVHDRKKDMINRGGYKIFTAEVESVLTAFPGVLESAVVSKPCPILGERVHAVVSVKEEVEEEVEEAALAAWCAERLADYKTPESFTVQREPLPRNHNGKIMKREIRAGLGFDAGR